MSSGVQMFEWYGIDFGAFQSLPFAGLGLRHGGDKFVFGDLKICRRYFFFVQGRQRGAFFQS